MNGPETDVLVIGAGPVGLALAIELGTRGIRVVVAERSQRGGNAPRAKTSNVRTRTHLRRWGLADRLAEASPLGIDYPNDVIFTTGLASHQLTRIPNAFNAAPARSPLYPEHAQWIPQYTLERIMREHAQGLPSVQFRFGSVFTSAEQDREFVQSSLEDSDGNEYHTTSRYLVGADGARSLVREVIGAKMEGMYALSRHYNVVFRAPGLAAAHPHGPGVMYWQIKRSGPSVIGPMDRDDVWFFMPSGIKDGERLSDADAARAIALATGIDLPFEILSADEWAASRLLADTYRSDRAFLAGDACHLHPPFGGYGMNTGVGDAVDLGWKLAAVIQGWGGEALLQSYEAERRPVHEAVIEEAVINHASIVTPLWRDGLDEDTARGAELRAEVGSQIQASKQREFNTLGAVLGFGYENSPVIEYDGSPPPVRNGQIYTPSARPGQLAPHAWIDDIHCLYDLFGPGFTLIVADDAENAQVDRALRDAQEQGVPLTVVRPASVPISDLYQAKLTLVRPDQHVAWRGTTWNTSVLKRATGNRNGALETLGTGR